MSGMPGPSPVFVGRGVAFRPQMLDTPSEPFHLTGGIMKARWTILAAAILLGLASFAYAQAVASDCPAEARDGRGGHAKPCHQILDRLLDEHRRVVQDRVGYLAVRLREFARIVKKITNDVVGRIVLREVFFRPFTWERLGHCLTVPCKLDLFGSI